MRLDAGPSQEYLDREGKPAQQVGIPMLDDVTMNPASVGNAAGFDAEVSSVAGGPQFDEEFEDSDEVKRARDKHPAAEHVEEALKLFEENVMARKILHWKGQERWGKEYEEERRGRPLHMYHFINALEGVGVFLKLNEFGRLGRIGVNALVCSGCSQGDNAECPANCTGRDYTAVLLQSGIYGVLPGPRKRIWKTITTLHNGWGPEYSVMRFDRFGVPTNEKFHGWRTALLVLMITGVVSKRQAVEAFGEARGNASAFYLEQVNEILHC